MQADKHRLSVEYDVGDFVWAILTKDKFPAHEYNKLASRKIGPLEFKHLTFCWCNSSTDDMAFDLRTNPLHLGEDDVVQMVV